MGSEPIGITIHEVRWGYEHFAYRTPIKFGGQAFDRVTVLNVCCRVRSRSGSEVWGFGSMPLGNVWAFPSRRLTYDRTLTVMQRLADKLGPLFADSTTCGHAIDLYLEAERHFDSLAKEVGSELNVPEPIPRLAVLVAASPFDAALHDALGKAYCVSSYATYEPPYFAQDLSRYLGARGSGLALTTAVAREPVAQLPLYHLIGALDPVEPADVSTPVGDGLPEHLAQWIEYNGLTHLKIKLNGDDLQWDLERVLRVEHVTAAVQRRRGIAQWWYSLDFNERCPHGDYLVDFLGRLRSRCPSAFERVQYIEQPTTRNLDTQEPGSLASAARYKPLVVDEALTDAASLQRAVAVGYTGAALKACKGQTHSLLLAALARQMGLFLCVQDLTCPGASLIHSAGLAAHVRGVASLEANARQYIPQANRPWEPLFPGLFTIHDGLVRTGRLTGPGLSALPGHWSPDEDSPVGRFPWHHMASRSPAL
ncbi:MAG: hypothetical protein C4297_02450 [Gemmataceae bacterium]